jgi:outer membrane receptor protein involved in Fe transport
MAASLQLTESLAQDVPPLEVVVVTATKREQPAQDVPISISVVSGERLVETGSVDLEDLSAYVPSFTLNETGIATVITIRGISSGINQGFEQSVGMYVDGIYHGRGQLARMPLLDLERVEVVRGPQPILLGRNSIGGAVLVSTARPTDEFEGSVSALFGDFGEENLQLVVSGPLTDSFKGRIAVLDRSMDGYMSNVWLGRDEQQEDESVFRSSFLWEPTDRLAIDAKLEHTDFDTVGRNSELVHSVALPSGGIDYITALSGTVAQYNGAVGAGLAPPPTIPYLADNGALDRVKYSGTDTYDNAVDNATLSIDYALGDSTLSFVSGFVQYDFRHLCDCDWVSAPLIDGSTELEEFEQFSQEIRLSSSTAGSFSYIAGLYFQDNELRYDDKINVPPDGVLRALNPAFANIDTRRAFAQQGDQLAAFGQVTWNASDVLRLTFGGRYTTEDKEATRSQTHFAAGTGLPPTDPTGTTPNPLWTLNPLFGAFLIEPYAPIGDERSESKFNPLVTVQWDATDSIMLYGTYVTGFKAGGFDARSNGHPDPAVVNALDVLSAPPRDIVGVFEFEEEKATSFELGAKMTLGAPRNEINVALYQTEYEDLQTSVYDGVLGFNVVNASKADIQGIEIDGRWAVARDLTLAASVAYLDFEYDDFPVAQCYFNDQRPSTGPGLCDATGDRREYTPEWTGAFIADYTRTIRSDLQFRLTAELIYSDDYIWSPTLDPVAYQESYNKVNLRLGVGSLDGKWEVALLGRNLTDEYVSNFGGNAPLAGPLTGGTGNAYYTFVDAPKSLALQGTVRFGGN